MTVAFQKPERGTATMLVLDIHGSCHVKEAETLLARLREVRGGQDGAFELSHNDGSSLSIHINGDAAYLCYFPGIEGQHPGFVPDKMWLGKRSSVRFLLVGGDEGDAISVPWWQLVPVEIAYRAAVEYLLNPVLPSSIHWFEL